MHYLLVVMVAGASQELLAGGGSIGVGEHLIREEPLWLYQLRSVVQSK
jgi:hypothetical protein